MAVCAVVLAFAARTPATTSYLEPQGMLQLCKHPPYCQLSKVSERSDPLAELYLYTLRTGITGALLTDDYYVPSLKKADGYRPNRYQFEPNSSLSAITWPVHALTMTGQIRINALHEILHHAYNGLKLEGDFLEAGTWRGGSSIYAKGFLKAYKLDRKVWVCDSFHGLPPKEHQFDHGGWNTISYLSVSKEQVADHFERHLLLDDDVIFVKGYFKDSLPPLRKRIGSLAVVRLDGDMYLSTMNILCNLWDRIMVGGYWIVDDYAIFECRMAVNMFLEHHGIHEKGPIDIDGQSVYFQKTKHVEIDAAWCAENQRTRYFGKRRARTRR